MTKQKKSVHSFGVCKGILRVVMILCTVVFGWLIDTGYALGWISNAAQGDNWPENYGRYGVFMIMGSVFLTASVILVLCHVNRISLLTAVAGGTLQGISLVVMANYAADSGFYSNVMDMAVNRLYYFGIGPTGFAYLALIILALMQFISYEERTKRQAKRDAKEAKAPSIL